MKKILTLIFTMSLIVGLVACVKVFIKVPGSDESSADSSTAECVHDIVIDEAVEATCTTAGKTEGKHCSKCNEVLTAQTTIAALGHEEVIDEAIEATCTTAGKTAGKHCSRCNTVLTAQTVIPAAHVEVIDEAVAATCTTAGKTAGSHCSRCNEVLTAQTTIPALGHTEVADAAVAATCTTAGKTAGSHCSRCNEVLTAQTTVAALGHAEVSDAAVAATCTTAGKTAGKHCSRCNTVLTAQTTVAALGHVEVVDAAVAATRTTEGKTAGKHCSRCNTVLTAQTTILKLEVLSGKWELKTLDVEFGNVLDFSATLSFSCNNTTYTNKQLRLWQLDDGSHSYVQIVPTTYFAVGDILDFGSTEQEVSGEFYAMFDKFFDPVAEYKISGVWKFNDSFSSSNLCLSGTPDEEVNFTSNGKSFVKFTRADQIIYHYADGTFENVFFRTFMDEAYRTIDFGTTEQTVTEDFYNWFTGVASTVNVLTFYVDYQYVNGVRGQPNDHAVQYSLDNGATWVTASFSDWGSAHSIKITDVSNFMIRFKGCGCENSEPEIKIVGTAVAGGENDFSGASSCGTATVTSCNYTIQGNVTFGLYLECDS